jgi:hypothetical protein
VLAWSKRGNETGDEEGKIISPHCLALSNKNEKNAEMLSP